MKRFRWTEIMWLLAFVAAAPSVRAQQAPVSPHIGYAFPAGGRQGTLVEVKVGGQFLAGASAAYLSDEGVQASVLAYDRPMTQREFQNLQQKLEDAQKKLQGDEGKRLFLPGLNNIAALTRIAQEAGVTNAELEHFVAFRRNRQDPKRQLNPQIAETVTVQIKIDLRAAPGGRELRLLTPLGLSNPLRFVVGQFREHAHVPKADGLGLRGAAEPEDRSPDELGAGLPVVINGRILPGGVDRFAFTARKGARLVVSASARELMPYLADAVPGWFQPALALYDAKGKEVAFADHDRFHPDPVLFYPVPERGKYVLEIRDALYRGREDFVYRITLGEIPFITSLFPLGSPAGAQTTVEVSGWNLSQRHQTLDGRAKEPGIYPVGTSKGTWISNSVPFAVDTLPETNEPASSRPPTPGPRPPTLIALPAIINGRIDLPGREDVFRFKGHTGEKIVAEVIARRLDSPLDSVLQLTDAQGRELAFNDDTEDKGAGLVTHQADSYLSVILPANGVYSLVLRDAQQRGGPEYAYRLRISPPRPDFELRVVPSSINARAGSTVVFTVYALRKDGFSGDIALEVREASPESASSTTLDAQPSAHDAKSGFMLGGGWVPGQSATIRLTLTVPPFPSEAPVKLHLDGRAVIQGREVRRTAVPADDMMQAFAYHHLVPAQELMVAVVGRAGRRLRLRPPAEPVKLPAGGTATVRLLGPGALQVQRVQVARGESLDSIAVQNVAADREGVTVRLRAEPDKLKPGFKGNLILDAVMAPIAAPANGTPGSARRTPLATFPAIPIEIVRP